MVAYMSEEYVDAYFLTTKGTALNQETYWKIVVEGEADYYFRFIQIQDSTGGLYGQIQDEVGHKGIDPNMFDQEEVVQITDPQEIALAMLAIHG